MLTTSNLSAVINESQVKRLTAAYRPLLLPWRHNLANFEPLHSLKVRANEPQRTGAKPTRSTDPKGMSVPQRARELSGKMSLQESSLQSIIEWVSVGGQRVIVWLLKGTDCIHYCSKCS